MTDFLSALVYALRYNLMGILFFGAALYCARRQKTFWHWFYCGLFLQGYSTFGAILGMFKAPEQWRTPENYAAVALFAVLALVLLVLLRGEEKRLPTKERKLITPPKRRYR